MIHLQIDTLRLLEGLLENFLAAIPNIVLALLIIIAGWALSKLLAKLLERLLRKLGIDKLAEKLNEIDMVSKADIKLKPSKLLAKILYYFLLFIFISAATDVLGMEPVSELMNAFLNYIPYLVSAFIVFLLGLFLADFIRNIVLTASQSLGIPAASFIASFVFYFLFLNVVMITLDQAQINTNFIQDNLSIILGGIVLAFAIGYGFASRPIVANLLSAYYHRNKVAIGDVISIEGVKGTVVDKDNSTITLSAEGRKLIVPLSKLASNTYEVFDE